MINFLIVAFCIFLVVQGDEQDEATGADAPRRCRRIARPAR